MHQWQPFGFIDFENCEITDISQPVEEKTACFPGDVPFKRNITVSFAESNVINLTSFTMSPHVGTHADSPIHIYGEMNSGEDMAASMPLSSFVGPCQVINLADCYEPITSKHLYSRTGRDEKLAPRLLFKTRHQIRYNVFEKEYASFTPELVEELHKHKIKLLGIDTPSVDPTESKGLETHHALHKHKMSWLENLDLTGVEEGHFILVALPLKLTELEASPVRAVLLRNKT